jgi:hypothetical protein
MIHLKNSSLQVPMAAQEEREKAEARVDLRLFRQLRRSRCSDHFKLDLHAERENLMNRDFLKIQCPG